MSESNNTPLLLRAARGEKVERTPVWMMRQAGRYMKIYRDLREKYPSFRDRSENPDLAIEISLQPWHAFKPDGVIMFSDILTPLPGMGIDFDIVESKGPQITDPIRTQAQVDAMTEGNYSVSYTVTDVYGNSAQLTRSVIVSHTPEQLAAQNCGSCSQIRFDFCEGEDTPDLEVLLQSNSKYENGNGPICTGWRPDVTTSCERTVES